MGKLKKKNFYADVRLILEQARGAAVRVVNFSMVIAIGKLEKEC